MPVLGPDAPKTVKRRVGNKEETVKQTPGKQPHNALWSDKERAVYGATAASLEHWRYAKNIGDFTNLGLACGSAAAVDIDVYDAELADAVEALAEEDLGVSRLRRVGQPPKRLLLYRTDGEPLRKALTPELWKDGVKAQVEVMGHGQQFVAFGVHPDTQAALQWDDETPETTPLAELPPVTQEQVAAFVAAAEALLRAAGYRTKAEIEARQAPRRRSNRRRVPRAATSPTRSVAPSTPSPARSSSSTTRRCGVSTPGCRRCPQGQAQPTTARGASSPWTSAASWKKTSASPRPASSTSACTTRATRGRASARRSTW